MPHCGANLRRRNTTVETQAAQLRKAGEEAAQLKQAEAGEQCRIARTGAAEDGRPGAGGRGRAQELTDSTAQHRQAFDEERARAPHWRANSPRRSAKLRRRRHNCTRRAATQSSSSKATESAMAELRQSLQQARDRTEAMAPGSRVGAADDRCARYLRGCGERFQGHTSDRTS